MAAVAYMNLDSAVVGSNFEAQASPVGVWSVGCTDMLSPLPGSYAKQQRILVPTRTSLGLYGTPGGMAVTGRNGVQEYTGKTSMIWKPLLRRKARRLSKHWGRLSYLDALTSAPDQISRLSCRDTGYVIRRTVDECVC